MLEDKKDLWVATARGGLNLLDRKTGKFTRFLHNPDDSTSLSHNWVTTIYEDKTGRLWVGTNLGLNLFDRENQQFRQYYYQPKTMNENSITDDLLEDNEGNLWIPYVQRGITMLNPKTGRLTRYRYNPNDPNTISTDYITDLLLDKKGRFWVASAAGLDLFAFQPEQEPPFTVVKRQLVQAPINSMLEDGNGILWLGTLQGLIRFDPETEAVRKYNTLDGLPSQAFDGGGEFKSPRTGELFFPTDGGLLIFHPDSLKDNPFIPPIAITSLYYYDSMDKSGTPIEAQNISYQEEIGLPYHQNTVVVEFAALSYNKTPKNQYAYKIEEINDNWIQLGTKRELTLTNLNPGIYNLWVKGSNGDDIWNEKGTRLKIIIRPPWWLTTTAKASYIILLLITLYALYRYLLTQRLKEAEAHRLRELDQVKTRLYTNITHEFRTPLTIILGMADRAVNNPKEWLLEGGRMIKRNGQRLLHLVNQMLDLAKLESGSMPLHMVNGDIIRYLRYLNESFHSYAELKGISLHFIPSVDVYPMDFDPAKLLDIISNLVSNAVKYTPEGGNVYMQVQEVQKDSMPFLEIKVVDTGVGMDEEELQHVFDRFYQAQAPSQPPPRGEEIRPPERGGIARTGQQKAGRREPTSPLWGDRGGLGGAGTGIGLALTRELVKLLGGEVNAESQKGKGSTFTVILPVAQVAEKAGQPEDALVQSQGLSFTENVSFTSPEEVPPAEANLPLLLIIEDNQDVVQYLISCLDGEYQLVAAPNGQAGIDKAIELVPDIIVSDVMMPEKDGFEVCNTLKQDERTSHIPIILLTAKADIESKLEGLQLGADAYLPKPFNERELNIRLKKLIELRRSLQERFGNNTAELSAGGRAFPLEDEFLRKVRQLVNDNLSDADYGIVQLCRALNMSRSQLFRKLKALTGKPTSLFIRSIRLQKAKQLLLDTGLNVSEIAYEVGFTSPAYFTRAFSEEFGVAPSGVRE
ncbi:MAG: response regulator [Lewinellaceae bacterium]|nr:response regulator [Lewinellaceae bacterium]